MNLVSNPFLILEIGPEDPIDPLLEKIDGSPDNLKKEENILTLNLQDSRFRLEAELSWLPDSSSEAASFLKGNLRAGKLKIEDIEKEGIGDFSRANLLAHFALQPEASREILEKLLPALSCFYSFEKVLVLQKFIDEKRGEAGVSYIRSFLDFYGEVDKRRREIEEILCLGLALMPSSEIGPFLGKVELDSDPQNPFFAKLLALYAKQVEEDRAKAEKQIINLLPELENGGADQGARESYFQNLYALLRKWTAVAFPFAVKNGQISYASEKETEKLIHEINFEEFKEVSIKDPDALKLVALEKAVFKEDINLQGTEEKKERALKDLFPGVDIPDQSLFKHQPSPSEEKGYLGLKGLLTQESWFPSPLPSSSKKETEHEEVAPEEKPQNIYLVNSVRKGASFVSVEFKGAGLSDYYASSNFVLAFHDKPVLPQEIEEGAKSVFEISSCLTIYEKDAPEDCPFLFFGFIKTSSPEIFLEDEAHPFPKEPARSEAASILLEVAEASLEIKPYKKVWCEEAEKLLNPLQRLKIKPGDSPEGMLFADPEESRRLLAKRRAKNPIALLPGTVLDQSRWIKFESAPHGDPALLPLSSLQEESSHFYRNGNDFIALIFPNCNPEDIPEAAWPGFNFGTFYFSKDGEWPPQTAFAIRGSKKGEGVFSLSPPIEEGAFRNKVKEFLDPQNQFAPVAWKEIKALLDRVGNFKKAIEIKEVSVSSSELVPFDWEESEKVSFWRDGEKIFVFAFPAKDPLYAGLSDWRDFNFGSAYCFYPIASKPSKAFIFKGEDPLEFDSRKCFELPKNFTNKDFIWQFSKRMCPSESLQPADLSELLWSLEREVKITEVDKYHWALSSVWGPNNQNVEFLLKKGDYFAFVFSKDDFSKKSVKRRKGFNYGSLFFFRSGSAIPEKSYLMLGTRLSEEKPVQIFQLPENPSVEDFIEGVKKALHLPDGYKRGSWSEIHALLEDKAPAESSYAVEQDKEKIWEEKDEWPIAAQALCFLLLLLLVFFLITLFFNLAGESGAEERRNSFSSYSQYEELQNFSANEPSSSWVAESEIENKENRVAPNFESPVPLKEPSQKSLEVSSPVSQPFDRRKAQKVNLAMDSKNSSASPGKSYAADLSPEELALWRAYARMSDPSAPFTWKPQEIRSLQQMLITLGYGGKADGLWGPRTEGRLKKFKQENGLPSDSSVTLEVLEKLIEENRKKE